MIVLLSPAKSLDYGKINKKKYSIPIFLEESEKLIEILCQKTTNELKSLMKISDKLADLNSVRYKNFSTPFTLDNAKQSIYAFKGDVYVGLEAEKLEETEVEFAQQYLRILSGLYGLLKPLDLMQAYRLEMGTKLTNELGKNLYTFWGEKITHQLNEDAQNANAKAIINLASNEYFKSVKKDLLKAPLYNIHFKENRNGQYKIISFSAKKARGMMAQYILKNRLTEPEQLLAFDMDKYVFNEELSEKREFVFTR